MRLFERGGRQDVELTDRGKVVLPYLRLMADDYEKMQEYAREYARQQARNLSIGYSPLVGTTGESEILANFQARCPEACVTHVLMENADLWQLLMQRKLDGAFFFTIGRKNPINAPWYGHLEPNLGSKMIYRSSRLYIGVGENHRFASRTSILAEELEEEKRRNVYTLDTSDSFFASISGTTESGNSLQSVFSCSEETGQTQVLHQVLLLILTMEGKRQGVSSGPTELITELHASDCEGILLGGCDV